MFPELWNFLVEDDDEETVTIFKSNFNQMYNIDPDFEDSLTLENTYTTDIIALYNLTYGDVLKDKFDSYIYLDGTLIKKIIFKDYLEKELEQLEEFENMEVFDQFDDKQKKFIKSFLIFDEKELKKLFEEEQKRNEEPTTKAEIESKARVQAPKGGVNVRGKFYPGGQFLPKDVVAELSDAEKEGIERGEDVGDVDVVSDENEDDDFDYEASDFEYAIEEELYDVLELNNKESLKLYYDGELWDKDRLDGYGNPKKVKQIIEGDGIVINFEGGYFNDDNNEKIESFFDKIEGGDNYLGKNDTVLEDLLAFIEDKYEVDFIFNENEGKVYQFKEGTEQIIDKDFPMSDFVETLIGDIDVGDTLLRERVARKYGINEEEFKEFIKNSELQTFYNANSETFEVINPIDLRELTKNPNSDDIEKFFYAMALHDLIDERVFPIDNDLQYVDYKNDWGFGKSSFSFSPYGKDYDDYKNIMDFFTKIEREGLRRNTFTRAGQGYSKDLLKDIDDSISELEKSVKVPSAEKNELRRWYYDNTKLDDRIGTLEEEFKFELLPAKSIEQFKSDPLKYYINGINEPLPPNFDIKTDSYNGEVKLYYTRPETGTRFPMGEIEYNLDYSQAGGGYTIFSDVLSSTFHEDFETSFNSDFQNDIRKYAYSDDEWYTENIGDWTIFEALHPMSILINEVAEKPIIPNHLFENSTSPFPYDKDAYRNSFKGDYFLQSKQQQLIGVTAFDEMENLVSYIDDEYENAGLQNFLNESVEDYKNYFKSKMEEFGISERVNLTDDRFNEEAKSFIGNFLMQEHLRDRLSTMNNSEFFISKIFGEYEKFNRYAQDSFRGDFASQFRSKFNDFTTNFNNNSSIFFDDVLIENSFGAEFGETLRDRMKINGYDNLQLENSNDRYNADSPLVRATMHEYFDEVVRKGFEGVGSAKSFEELIGGETDRRNPELDITYGKMKPSVRSKGLYTYLRRQIMNIADQNEAVVNTSASPTIFLNNLEENIVGRFDREIDGGRQEEFLNSDSIMRDLISSFSNEKRRKIADYYFSFGSGDSGSRPPKK